MTRGLNRRRGEVAHQDVRQRCGTQHHTGHQGHELPACHGGLARGGKWNRQGLEAALGAGNGIQRAETMQGFEFGNAGNRVTVNELRDQAEALLIGHPEYRYQVSDDQYDVLRHLGPGYRAHTAEHGTQQDAEQPEPDADFERNLQCTRRDGAGGVDLRGYISKRRDRQHNHTEEARQVTAVAGTDEVRHGVATELTQVRRHQRGNQDVTPGPADHERQITMTAEVDATGHRYEGGARHPVRSRRHTVEYRGYLATGDVIRVNRHGPRQHPDTGVDDDGEGDEQDTDGIGADAHLLEDCH